MNQITRFKYSFIALIATILAIIINLTFTLNHLHLIALILTCACLILASFYFNNKLLLTTFVFLLLGFTSSALYNNNTKLEPLNNVIDQQKAWVSGVIKEIKFKHTYARIIIKEPVIYSSVFDSLKYKDLGYISISTFASRLKNAKIGDTLVAKVLLQKPKEKLFEDDFNYSNYLLQNNINLTAQVRGDIYTTPPEKGYNWLNKIANWRLELKNIITEKSGVTLALLTGQRGFIDKKINANYKKAGLAHLMAISGMHLAFVCGSVFLLIRFMLALIPSIALNYSSQSIAVIASVSIGFLYMLLAGSSLPTIRAFSMVLIFAITLLLKRSKVALHTLCLIAIIILTLDPPAVFSASFQLSFSAVFAMLLYTQIKQDDIIISRSYFSKITQSFINIVNISIIAFSATLVFVAFHFHYISPFAIIANIFASILMGFIVMPILVLYFIGYILLNIEFFAFLNQLSINILNNLACYFANFENSSIFVSQWYSFVLLIAVLLVLYLIIFNFKRNYLLSSLILTSIFYLPIKYDQRPQIVKLNNAIALRLGNQAYFLGEITKQNKNKFLHFYRLTEMHKQPNMPKNCDISGCVYQFNHKTISVFAPGFYKSTEDTADYIL